MKYLFIFLTFFTTASHAQTDTSAATIFVNLKQKHYAIFAAQLSTNFKAADVKVLDSLKKGVGSGTKVDSVCIVGFKAGRLLAFISDLLSQPVGSHYDFATELFKGVSGWTGLSAQLTAKVSGSATDKGAAVWLLAKLTALLDGHQDVLIQTFNNGVFFAKQPIIYN